MKYVLVLTIVSFTCNAQDTTYCLSIQTARLLVSDAITKRYQDSLIISLKERIVSDSISSVFREQSYKREIGALEQQVDAQGFIINQTEHNNTLLRKELKREKRKSLIGGIGCGLLILLLAF